MPTFRSLSAVDGYGDNALIENGLADGLLRATSIERKRLTANGRQTASAGQLFGPQCRHGLDGCSSQGWYKRGDHADQNLHYGDSGQHKRVARARVVEHGLEY
jgi:hypothetical protein